MKTTKIIATFVVLIAFASSAFAIPTLTVDLTNLNADGHAAMSIDFEGGETITALGLSSNQGLLSSANETQRALFNPDGSFAGLADGHVVNGFNLFFSNTNNSFNEGSLNAQSVSGVVDIPNDSTGPGTGKVGFKPSAAVLAMGAAELAADSAGDRSILSWGFVPNSHGDLPISWIAVPEPSSIAMLLLGVVALVFSRRR